MIVCTGCKTENKDGSKFCKSCGEILTIHTSEKLCKACGKPLKPGNKFCTYCGVSIENGSSSQDEDDFTNNNQNNKSSGQSKKESANKQKIVKTGAIGGAIILILVLIWALVGSGVFERPGQVQEDYPAANSVNTIAKQGIYYIRDKSACLYEDADINSEIVTKLDRYTQVEADEMSGDMIHVFNQHFSGWVESSRLYEIGTPDNYSGTDITENNNYVIISDYADGIKVHPQPNKGSDTLWKVYEGDAIYVEYITSDNYGYIVEENRVGWINLKYALDEGTYDNPAGYYSYGGEYQLCTNVFVRYGPDKSFDKVYEDALTEGEHVYANDIYNNGGDVWLCIDSEEDMWICAYNGLDHKFYAK